jgi:hypothetical protein
LPMRLSTSFFMSAAIIAILAGSASAQTLAPGPGQTQQPPQQQQQPAQQQPPQQQPAQGQRSSSSIYASISVTMPGPATDPSFEGFRKQVGEVAAKKDRPGLTRLVVGGGFFWIVNGADAAAKNKSSVDNLSDAVGGLAGRDAAGWDALADAADDPTLEGSPGRAGVMCAPAGPVFDRKAFDDLLKATNSEADDWNYVVEDNVEVRASDRDGAPVIEKIGPILVRIIEGEEGDDYIRIMTPSGKIGFVLGEQLGMLTQDQICYRKEGANWKIAGYIGGGE